jgi:hypothetical protein
MKNRWHTYEYFHTAHSVGIKKFPVSYFMCTWKDFKSLDPRRHLCYIFIWIIWIYLERHQLDLVHESSHFVAVLYIETFRLYVIHFTCAISNFGALKITVLSSFSVIFFYFKNFLCFCAKLKLFSHHKYYYFFL